MMSKWKRLREEAKADDGRPLGNTSAAHRVGKASSESPRLVEMSVGARRRLGAELARQPEAMVGKSAWFPERLHVAE